VANLVDADLLVLLTDIDGLYTADPQHNSSAKLITKVENIDAEIERVASKTTTPHGVGGMSTKVEAARLATSSGIPVVIANGQSPDALRRVVAGESFGTLFPSRTSKLESKKRWMLSGLASKGRLIIDNGAAVALRKQNKSLLPAGIVGIESEFQRGDVVNIFDSEGNHIGCGISNYNSNDIATIKGAHSKAISSLLGYAYDTEVIHRNNMVLTE